MKTLLHILKERITTLLYLLFFVTPLSKVQSVYADRTVIALEDAVKSGIVNERVDIDVDTRIYKDRETNAPMTYLIETLKSRPANTPTVVGFEQRAKPDTVTINGSISAPSSAGDPITVTLTAGHRKFIALYDTLKFLYTPDTGNGYTAHGWVTAKSTNNANQITVVPTQSSKKLSKNSSGIPDGVKIIITGNMYNQHSKSVTPTHILTNKVTNVTQIIRTGFELSRTAGKQRMFGESERSRNRHAKQLEHLASLEKTLLGNGAMEVVDQSQDNTIQRGYMEGLFYTVKKNSDKNLQYDNPDEFLDYFDVWETKLFNRQIIDGVQRKRFALVNTATSNFFTYLKRERPGVDISDNKSFGIDGIKTIKTGNGVLDYYVHPYCDLEYSDPKKPFICAMHLAYIEHRPFQKTILRANIQDNDIDGTKDEWLTEFTYTLYLPELHGVLEPEPLV